jgi:hypothetical protein
MEYEIRHFYRISARETILSYSKYLNILIRIHFFFTNLNKSLMWILSAQTGNCSPLTKMQDQSVQNMYLFASYTETHI